MSEALDVALAMLDVETEEELVAKLGQIMIAGDDMATQLEIIARDLREVFPSPTQAWNDMIDATERQAKNGRRFFPEVT
jgi:hypothetical protein